MFWKVDSQKKKGFSEARIDSSESALRNEHSREEFGKFKGTTHENVGFRGKKGQKIHSNFATNIAIKLNSHTFYAPFICQLAFCIFYLPASSQPTKPSVVIWRVSEKARNAEQQRQRKVTRKRPFGSAPK